jgi:hypothetical protein
VERIDIEAGRKVLLLRGFGFPQSREVYSVLYVTNSLYKHEPARAMIWTRDQRQTPGNSSDTELDATAWPFVGD